MFEPRYRTFSPEEYGDLKLPIWVNPTNAELVALFQGVVEGKREDFGRLIVQTYRGVKVEAYDATFDFSSPDKALETLEDEKLPEDLRYWLRNAPMEAVIRERESLVKNLKAS